MSSLWRMLLIARLLTLIYGQFRYWRKELELAHLARGRAPPPVLQSQPIVSVLAAAWNPDEDVRGFVEAFRAVSYTGKELVLAIGGAHDLRTFSDLSVSNVRLVQHPGGIGKNRALARCLDVASGEVIVLTDADCRLDGDAFISLIAPIVNGQEVATTGILAPSPDQRRKLLVEARWANVILDFVRAPAYIPGLRGANCALQRKVLDEAGGFEPDILGDDYYLALKVRRLGHRIRFVSGSAVETRYKDSLRAYIRQQTRWRRSRLLAYLDLGDSAGALASMQRPLLGCLILACTVLLPFKPKFALRLLLPPLLRRYVSQVRCFHLAAEVGLLPFRPRHLFTALAYVYLDIIASALGTLQMLSSRTRKQW